MKKYLLSFFAMALIAISAKAQIVAEIDWTSMSAYYNDMWYSDECKVTVTKGQGLVIESTPADGANFWEPQVPMIGHIPAITKGGQYQVKFTIDAPASGEIRLDFCSWDGTDATVSKIIEITAGEAEYIVNFNYYPTECVDAMIFYQCGKIPGRHIIKNVQVLSKNQMNLNPTVYYASPTGTDAEGTSKSAPGNLFEMTWKLKAGDELILLDGQYDLSETWWINLKGTPTAHIIIRADENATPILDFRNQSDGLGVGLQGEYTHLKGITIRYAAHIGIWNFGSYNILECLDVYGNYDTGIQNVDGGHNMIINCDSHDNFDYKHLLDDGSLDYGGNADGFADKWGKEPYSSNVYIGCRAWNNSDDGFDFWERISGEKPTVVINCISYHNGPETYDMTKHPRLALDKEWFNKCGETLSAYKNYGNGNGFKLGGYGTIHNVELYRCQAVGNRNNGFDQNDNAGKMKVINCMAYQNGYNYGFYRSNPFSLDIHNCISLEPTGHPNNHFWTGEPNNVTQSHNSWNDGFSVSASDFESLDVKNLIIAPRNADGSLPETQLFHLKPTATHLIDEGIIYPASIFEGDEIANFVDFKGAAPDLGCYEYEGTDVSNNEQELSLLKVSYDGLNEFPYLGLFYDEGTGAKLEMVPDGVAITNPRRQDNHWDTQSQVTDDCLTLEKGHSYIVRLTLKAPSDGTYQVQLGNWNTGTCAQYAVSVTARNEWQIIDVEFPNFDGFVDGDGCVVFLNGWVVGTTILKKIEILELKRPIITAKNITMTYGSEIPELTCYAQWITGELGGTPKLSTTVTKTSPVGTYPIKIEKGTITNEDVSFVDGTLTITQAPLTVSVQDVIISRGEAIPSFTLIYDGFRNNDTEETAFTKKPTAKTYAQSDSPAGVYDIYLNGGEAPNYALTYYPNKLTILSASGDKWRDLNFKRQITHPQPMTGLVLRPYKAEELHNTYGQSIQLEYDYYLPCDIVKGCKEDGTIIYDWSSFDAALNDVASRGHQLVPRFRYVWPGSGPTTVPDYIKQLPDYHETYSDVDGEGPTFYPDWSNAELQRFTLQFYTDFFKRYAHDPRLAFIQIGFGHWAEYHIYPTPVEYGKNFPSLEYQKKFLIHLSEVSDGMPWLVSKNAGDNSPIPDDDELLALRFGLFEDSFMGEFFLNGGYKVAWNGLGGETRWQIGAVGGEIGPSYEECYNFLNPEGLYGHFYEEVASKYHVTFMGGNCAPDNPNGTPERIKQVSMATGYRFVVKKCATDGKSTLLLVSNEGIAPIYRDAYFAIGDVRSKTSLKGLLPNEERWIEIAAVPHSDGEDIKIVSDHILPQQEIEFEVKIEGDANGDGLVNAADIVEVVNAINGKESANFKHSNADMNKNGIIDKTDIDMIVICIFATD